MKNTDHYARTRELPTSDGYTRQRHPGAEGLANNAPTRPMRGSPAGGGYSTLDDMAAFTTALRKGTLLDVRALGSGFQELGPGPEGRVGSGMGGGAPGLNAAVEMMGDYTIIVLANLDPPTAERAAATLQGWIPGGAGAAALRPRVRVPTEGPRSAKVPRARSGRSFRRVAPKSTWPAATISPR